MDLLPSILPKFNRIEKLPKNLKKYLWRVLRSRGSQDPRDLPSHRLALYFACPPKEGPKVYPPLEGGLFLNRRLKEELISDIIIIDS
jgi:hypothetical protein